MLNRTRTIRSYRPVTTVVETTPLSLLISRPLSTKFIWDSLIPFLEMVHAGTDGVFSNSQLVGNHFKGRSALPEFLYNVYANAINLHFLKFQVNSKLTIMTKYHSYSIFYKIPL